MTAKELKRLNRAQLLEMLIALTEENDTLRTQLADAQEELNQRQIALSNAGSIAEAALQLNRVFDAAQAAADQYLEHIESMEKETQQKITAQLEEAEKKCRTMEEDTKERCRALQHRAELDAQQNWRELTQRLDQLDGSTAELKDYLTKKKKKKESKKNVE